MRNSCIYGYRRLNSCTLTVTHLFILAKLLLYSIKLVFSVRVYADCLPVQFDTRLPLQLSPQLEALPHHVGVKVFIVGPANDSGLAMGAPSGVGQDELEKMNIIPLG